MIWLLCCILLLSSVSVAFAGGAINCRTFPASDKYRQFEDPTAPEFAGQPTMASYAVFGSNIPNWRTTGTSGQVNKDVIPYLKGVAASTNKESKEAYNRMQFYGVYQRFQTPSAIITHNNLLSVYRSQFKLYNKEGNRIENDLIDFTQLSPASAVKNEATGELEKPA